MRLSSPAHSARKSRLARQIRAAPPLRQTIRGVQLSSVTSQFPVNSQLYHTPNPTQSHRAQPAYATPAIRARSGAEPMCWRIAAPHVRKISTQSCFRPSTVDCQPLHPCFVTSLLHYFAVLFRLTLPNTVLYDANRPPSGHPTTCSASPT